MWLVNRLTKEIEHQREQAVERWCPNQGGGIGNFGYDAIKWSQCERNHQDKPTRKDKAGETEYEFMAEGNRNGEHHRKKTGQRK